MPLDRQGIFTYPGIIAVESGTYTCSHGISPGIISLQIQPQSNWPDPIGDVTITDNYGTVVIPNCRFVNEKGIKDERGEVICVQLEDRRWRWRDFGVIFGCYNQLDPHGKLIPWTIKSPTELMLACMAALQENNVVYNLPPGLDTTFGIGVTQFLTPGQVFPLTGLNPAVNWDGVLPAHAAQQIAELFGCRIVYDVINDTILITPIGIGGPLPDGNVFRYGPTVSTVPTPDSIMVVGAPIKYQGRFALEAVGEEWDGTYQPLEQLSYAPNQVQAQQETVVSLSVNANSFNITNTAAVWSVSIVFAGNTRTYTYTNGFGALSLIKNNLIAQINAFNLILPCTASSINNTSFKLTGRNFWSFRVDVSVTAVAGVVDRQRKSIKGVTTAPCRFGGRGFWYSDPVGEYAFADVQAVPGRLTYDQARDLAQKSVFKYYRVSDIDVSGKGDIQVPGYAGPINRRQQIHLLPSKVEQAVPTPPNPNYQDTRGGLDEIAQNQLAHFIADYYNGYSRDKKAVIYGAVFQDSDAGGVQVVNLQIDPRGNNTLGTDIIYTPDFTIDPVWQIVAFNAPVYYAGGDNGSLYLAAALTLETGCYVRDVNTNQFAQYTQSQQLNFGVDITDTSTATIEILKRPDVQLSVYGTYKFVNAPIAGAGGQILNNIDYNSVITGVNILEVDPIYRANYYLQGMLLKYQIPQSQTIDYNGIVPISCDGGIFQVTWSVGRNGATTTASQNTEHSIWVPPFPDRRRIERLNPYTINPRDQFVIVPAPPGP